MRPHRGVLILVFKILSMVLCPFLGIAAWMMGDTDLKEIAYGAHGPIWKRPDQRKSNLRNDRDDLVSSTNSTADSF